MPRDAIADRWSLSAPVQGAGLGHRVTGLFLGLAFTTGLFLGIARYEKGAPERPPSELGDLRVALLPIEPPPLPVTPSEPEPNLTPIPGFDLSPAESAVKISVSPPDLSAILPEEMSKAPPANARVGPLLSDFKPKMDFIYDAQHIYQKSDVDEPPLVLDHSDIQISKQVLGDGYLHVTLLVVIEPSGEATNIRLTKSSNNAEFDRLMLDYIKEWVFSPAKKSGKKVRCLIEQVISVKRGAGSRFHT